MPLESIALVGGVLLAVVVAAMVGSLLGRRLRTAAVDRRQHDSRATAVSETHASREAMHPTPEDDATAAPPIAPTPSDVPDGAPSDAPIVAAMAAASRPASAAAAPFVLDPPPIAGASAGVALDDPPPIAQPAAGVVFVDPLARTATQRGDVPDYTSGAGFANRLAAVPPPVATRSTSSESPATRDREALEAATAIAAATAVKRTRRGRPPKEPKTPRRRKTDWILNGTLVVAIAIVGAIAFSAFVWSPPEGEIPLPSGAPDESGIALGSFDPGDEVLPFDPRAVGVIETSTPPLTGEAVDTEGGTGPDAQEGGIGPDRPTPTPGPGATPKPTPGGGGGGGGGGGQTPDPTAPPTPEPTQEPTPDPTPKPTPKPPVVAFNVDVTGLTADFANRTRNGSTWSWTFGDGADSTARNPNHTYEESGTYTVTLTATSPEGATDSLSKSVTVGG